MSKEIIDKWLNEEYGVSYTDLEKLHNRLVDKNQELEQENKVLQDMDKILRNENTNLKLRIIKAIEYIEEQTKGYQDDFDRVAEESWLYDLKITLNILKGGNNE